MMRLREAPDEALNILIVFKRFKLMPNRIAGSFFINVLTLDCKMSPPAVQIKYSQADNIENSSRAYVTP